MQRHSEYKHPHKNALTQLFLQGLKIRLLPQDKAKMKPDLSRIDLNLLIALQVLLEERNVTRAAKRLFITQPAMSKTLQRLRLLFDDPLFTRASHGLVPTPRAQLLQRPLNIALERLEHTLFTPEFVPAEAEGRIHISAPEILSVGAIPAVLKRVYYKAPKLQVKSRNMLDDASQLLASGALDFAIYVEQGYSNEFELFHLASNEILCWFRRDHPLASKETLDVDDLVSYPHIVLYLPNVTERDMLSIGRAFRDTGRSRDIIFQTTQLLTSLEVLGNSDTLMLGPSYITASSLTRGHFISRSLPPEFSRLKLNLYLIQHYRTLNSPLHRWLREQLFDVFRKVTKNQSVGEKVVRRDHHTV